MQDRPSRLLSSPPSPGGVGPHLPLLRTAGVGSPRNRSRSGLNARWWSRGTSGSQTPRRPGFRRPGDGEPQKDHGNLRPEDRGLWTSSSVVVSQPPTWGQQSSTKDASSPLIRFFWGKKTPKRLRKRLFRGKEKDRRLPSRSRAPALCPSLPWAPARVILSQPLEERGCRVWPGRQRGALPAQAHQAPSSRALDRSPQGGVGGAPLGAWRELWIQNQRAWASHQDPPLPPALWASH